MLTPEILIQEGWLVTTDAQVVRLMEEMSKHGRLGLAALRSGMSENTARKYVRAGKVPSELKSERHWRTRPDPFTSDWPEVVEQLTLSAELEAKTLFEALQERRPGVYHEGQLRTFQRRVRDWRAQHGPEKEVFFAQEHRPGEALQLDFTNANELRVTIAGEPFEHLLSHVVLPFSNWTWACVCHSESLLALRRGLQAAVFELGHVPKWVQTDNSSAATHQLSSGERGFNAEYQRMARYLGMEPRTIGVGQSEQNGDIERQNGNLKSKLNQALLLRGSRDFDNREAYENFVRETVRRANRGRQEKLAVELSEMRPLNAKRLPEWREEEVLVTTWSTIRVRHNAYSVPSRLIGERVRVRIYEDKLVVSHKGVVQLEMERLRGRMGQQVDYRHVIWSLVRKPGAFERYRYRESMFPTLTFRRAYDRLKEALSEREADVEYLRVLHLAASTLEREVEAAIELLLEQGSVPRLSNVQGLIGEKKPAPPMLEAPEVDLTHFDGLLGAAAEVGG